MIGSNDNEDFSVGKAAQFLQVSESKVQDYIAGGQLEGTYIDTGGGLEHKIPYSSLLKLRPNQLTSLDERVREAAMLWLEQRSSDGAESLHTLDLDDFRFDGEPFRLKDITKGIWKPRSLEAALSITTVYREPGKEAPYRD
ncbi:MAG: hypothetical protein WBX27_18445, partial [Specibacter sp.]